ncbi:MAG: AraC family transcriptional regulator [Caldicoprobacterales bacterium]|nr:AraC family transcriptional regulator [Clostridiales bacterium]
MNSLIETEKDPGFLIDIEYSKRQGYFTMPFNHYHSYYELYYLLNGVRNYFIKDKVYSVTSGDLVLINKYEIHKTSDSTVPHHERLLIYFREEFLYAGSNEEMDYLLHCFRINKPVIRLQPPEQAIVKDLIHKMHKEQYMKKTGYMSYLRALLTELLILANRLLETRDQVLPDANADKTIHKRISKIVQYINSNYSDSLSLSSVANSFYISPYYLSRLFKEVTGFNFTEYLNLVRIREAQNLIQGSDMKIIDVAQAVGFENVAHFGRVFKHITSLSPTSYRKKHRE